MLPKQLWCIMTWCQIPQNTIRSNVKSKTSFKISILCYFKVPNFVLKVSYNRFTCTQGQKPLHFLKTYIASHVFSRWVWNGLMVIWLSLFWSETKRPLPYLNFSSSSSLVYTVIQRVEMVSVLLYQFQLESSSVGNACKVDLVFSTCRQLLYNYSVWGSK